MKGPSVREGSIPAGALDALLGALREAGGWVPELDALLDRAVALREARRFKLDVSFAPRGARFSLNDKGEPEAFRARLRAVLPGLVLERFLALSPPGAVQTTVGVKANAGQIERFSLYYEELPPGEEGERLRRAVLALAGVDAPAPGHPAVAACVDLDPRGAVLAAKDYALLEGEEGPFPEERARFPSHPITGNRRFLYARRFAPGGVRTGTKLMWMSETHRPADVARAWAEVDRLRAGLPPNGALERLRAGWSFAPEVFLHPDLLSVERDAEGRARGVLVYVSVR